MRLDQLLAETFGSRAKAQAAIENKAVKVNGILRTKPSFSVSESDAVEISEALVLPWVGRGALKLLYALEAFALDVSGRTCLDIGASTGGFTQVLLAKGAARVYAIDVGTGQLADILKEDARVVNLEKTDFRAVNQTADFACCDVSFISLKHVLPKLYALAPEAVCLLKPQFEVRGKHVIRDPRLHRQIQEDILRFARDTGFQIKHITESPILGGEGNKEFLLHLAR